MRRTYVRLSSEAIAATQQLVAFCDAIKLRVMKSVAAKNMTGALRCRAGQGIEPNFTLRGLAMKVTLVGNQQGEQDAVQENQPEQIEQELQRQGVTSGLSVYLNLADILRREIPSNYQSAFDFPDLVENLRQAGDFLCQTDQTI